MQQQKRPQEAVPEAPTLHPTAEEFKDPLAYVRGLRHEYGRFGIVKVVPPAGWEPASRATPKDAGRFSTKRQQLHRLQEGHPFEDGGHYSPEEYRAYGNKFKAEYMERHPELAADLEKVEHAGGGGGVEARVATVIEREYWRLVETAEEEVEVDYGNDICTSTFGTCFDPKASPRSPWDLSRITRTHSSALKHVSAVPGVTEPWLYFGSLFCTFCWHTEDHFLYSTSYLHRGANKTWYGIPTSDATKFEAAMRDSMPQRVKEDPDLLYHIVSLPSPMYLRSQGVKVYHAVQTPGSFMVTFPRAYHAGFSHGWNSAEAVNLAPADWLPFGRNAVALNAQKKKARRGAVFSHDWVVWQLAWSALELKKRCAQEGRPMPASVDWGILHSELQRTWEDEAALRAWLREFKIPEIQVERLQPPLKLEEECCVCQNLVFLSAVRCKRHKHVTCLNHAYTRCACEDSEKVLEIRVPDRYLSEMVGILGREVDSFNAAGVAGVGTDGADVATTDNKEAKRHLEEPEGVAGKRSKTEEE